MSFFFVKALFVELHETVSAYRQTNKAESYAANGTRTVNNTTYDWVALKRAGCRSDECVYARSPRMRRASWMSLGMMVTRLAWMAHKLVSSKSPTK